MKFSNISELPKDEYIAFQGCSENTKRVLNKWSKHFKVKITFIEKEKEQPLESILIKVYELPYWKDSPTKDKEMIVVFN